MSIAWLAAGAGRPPRLINGISLQRLRSAQLSIIQADNFPGGGDGLRCINTSILPLVTRASKVLEDYAKFYNHREVPYIRVFFWLKAQTNSV